MREAAWVAAISTILVIDGGACCTLCGHDNGTERVSALRRSRPSANWRPGRVSPKFPYRACAGCLLVLANSDVCAWDRFSAGKRAAETGERMPRRPDGMSMRPEGVAQLPGVHLHAAQAVRTMPQAQRSARRAPARLCLPIATALPISAQRALGMGTLTADSAWQQRNNRLQHSAPNTATHDAAAALVCSQVLHRHRYRCGYGHRLGPSVCTFIGQLLREKRQCDEMQVTKGETAWGGVPVQLERQTHAASQCKGMLKGRGKRQ